MVLTQNLGKEESCSKVVLELTQSVSVVFDPPVQQNGKQDWSFVKLFGSPLSTICPIATTSKVYVDTSSNKSGSEFQLNLEPSEMVHKESLREGNSMPEKTFAVFDLKDILEKSRYVNVGATYKKPHIYGIIMPPVLHADRKITGFGQEQGGIHCTFYNHHPKKALKIVYLDVIPWYLRLYTHTLAIKHGSKDIKPDRMHYEPARDRSRPHHLELMLTLPPKSVVELSVEYDLAFLKWTEYPPDANHGFYVGSAVISGILDSDRNISHFPSSTSSNSEGHFVRVHTQILLVSLPTPDFSMPYNVICLTCTVVALAFGPIHNITTKVLHPVDEQKKESMFSKLKMKIRNLWGSKPQETVSDPSETHERSR
ncbi:GPI transamidase component PIG-T-like [Uloborus diversus]|uniref:GPI transamidase component PIG-T-like n=1 Tax=Uloborus diversus TaxID=327109 RepID=UPI00240945AD|nr:GPI transamidase component PIG-T-like [Uloborus diversus]